jgi:hypothetical protein
MEDIQLFEIELANLLEEYGYILRMNPEQGIQVFSNRKNSKCLSVLDKSCDVLPEVLFTRNKVELDLKKYSKSTLFNMPITGITVLGNGTVIITNSEGKSKEFYRCLDIGIGAVGSLYHLYGDYMITSLQQDRDIDVRKY